MGNIKEEYKSFFDDIEKNIKNKEDLEYIKKRFTSFFEVVFERFNTITEDKEERIQELEKSQNMIEEKVSKMEEIIKHIEKDIYSEEGFDFEIVCPYCNNEFVIDMDEDEKEVKCPECNNIIELDWTGDLDDEESCSGDCHSCGGCNIDEEDDDM